MIATVNGKLLVKSPESSVIDVNGIGVLVVTPLSTYYALPNVGETVFLYTNMIVREDLIRLYGFFTDSEVQMFKVLIDVNRIGPKLALSILSGVTADELQRAVIQQDFRVLTSIPGIGKKSAERILFEVRDKLEQLGKISANSNRKTNLCIGQLGTEVVGVLVNLGYRQKDAESAVDSVISKENDSMTVDDLIRKALKILAGR